MFVADFSRKLIDRVHLFHTKPVYRLVTVARPALHLCMLCSRAKSMKCSVLINPAILYVDLAVEILHPILSVIFLRMPL